MTAELETIRAAAIERRKQREAVEKEMWERGMAGELWENGKCAAWPLYVAAEKRLAGAIDALTRDQEPIPFCSSCGGRLDWPAPPDCLYRGRHSS